MFVPKTPLPHALQVEKKWTKILLLISSIILLAHYFTAIFPLLFPTKRREFDARFHHPPKPQSPKQQPVAVREGRCSRVSIHHSIMASTLPLRAISLGPLCSFPVLSLFLSATFLASSMVPFSLNGSIGCAISCQPIGDTSLTSPV